MNRHFVNRLNYYTVLHTRVMVYLTHIRFLYPVIPVF